jgi:hypothetical protein
VYDIHVDILITRRRLFEKAVQFVRIRPGTVEVIFQPRAENVQAASLFPVFKPIVA